MNQKSVILDLCAGTGAWSEPYREAGYDVRRIDLPAIGIEIKERYCEIAARRLDQEVLELNA